MDSAVTQAQIHPFAQYLTEHDSQSAVITPVLWVTPASLFQCGAPQAASVMGVGSLLQDIRFRPSQTQVRYLMRIQQMLVIRILF